MNAAVVKLVRHGDVAVVEIDSKPVNALSKHVRIGLLNALATSLADPTVSAVVLYGGQGRFIARADIKELAGTLEEPFLPDIIAAIDTAPKPVLAAIDGAALGGGLEIALACDRRIASTRAVLALPETRLGLIPGAGGTQRLPRLVGIEWAEAMITTGEALKAWQALDIGLIDNLVDDPLEKAISAAGTTCKRRLSAATVPAARHGSPTFARLRNNDPAISAAVSLIKDTLTLSFKDGLARERETFLTLRADTRAQALIHLFLSSRAAYHLTDPLAADTTIGSVAISGKGQRAKAIPTLLSRSGIPIYMGEELNDADLVIDASDERNAEVAIRRLASRVKPGAILATTRSRAIDRLAAVSGRPEDVLGIHVRLLRGRSLVEVITAATTAPKALRRVLELIRKSGAQAVITRQPGIVGERIIAAGRAAADELRRRGVPRKEVEAALQSCGVLDRRIAQSAPTASENAGLRRHLLDGMAREGMVLLAEGIVRHPFDIDLILVHGYGFPREDGGPMWAAGVSLLNEATSPLP